MNKVSCGMVVSCNWNYVQYLNVLINSLEKYKTYEGCDLTLYLIHDDIKPEYIDQFSKLSFPVKTIDLDLFDCGLNTIENIQRGWKYKASRYYYLREISSHHDVCCLMDADLFVASKNFPKLFDMVRGTKNLIGSNERNKWYISEIYTFQDKPILNDNTRLMKFHCNVPLILDPQQWVDVIEDYLKIVYRGIEYREEQKKIIGDIYSWNISVYRNNRQDDCILFPMETMTQVHLTGCRDWTRVKKISEFEWYTDAGDEVYTLHGRPDTEGFYNCDYDKHKIKQSFHEHFKKIFKLEWDELNNFKISI